MKENQYILEYENINEKELKEIIYSLTYSIETIVRSSPFKEDEVTGKYRANWIIIVEK